MASSSAAPAAAAHEVVNMTETQPQPVELQRSASRTQSLAERRVSKRASVFHLHHAKEDIPWQVSFPLAKHRTNQNNIRTTKYTILTFIPLNLYFQFRRFYNFYFLLGALTVFYGSSSLSPFSMIFPLVIVLLFSAAKDAIEDYSRYLSDREANNAPAKALRNGTKVDILAKDIEQGDVIYLTKGEKLPVDAMVLSTAYDDGTCFIETAELDGETNLKRRSAVAALASYTSPETISKLKIQIQCERPNENLINYTGRVAIQSVDSHGTPDFIPLSMTNLLLRGAVLRNTDYAYAVVVYTGKNTKIIKNLHSTGLKSSQMEKKLNWLICGMFVYNAVLLFVSVFLQWAGYTSVLNTETSKKATNPKFAYYWYLGAYTDSSGKDFADYFFSYFALYSYVIPISLFVSIELVRLAQGRFMAWDKKMQLMRQPAPGAPSTEKPQKVRMKPNNTNLNEDLGTIEYVFSDKTGTLTQNEMRLAKWYVGGTEFDDMQDPGCLGRKLQDPKVDANTQKLLFLYSRAIALCHNVIPSVDEVTHNMVYESQSPDETALLMGIAASKVKLTFRAKSEIRVEVPNGGTETYELLNLLDFTSDRKRMSVIVRDPRDNKIHLFCKGADNIILARLSKDGRLNPPGVIHKAEEALKGFSEVGLRTLMIAHREFTEEEFEHFLDSYEVAERSLENREAKVAEASELAEKDLVFLGCTAIEDRLQDMVPESIEYLLKSGCKVWLLTGDKKETAINIGMSSRLIHASMRVLVLTASSKEEAGEKLAEMVRELEVSQGSGREFALVVTGEVLGLVLADPQREPLLLRVGVFCHSVICCRVTPLQKALVVQMVKNGLKVMTLAIGDGANDVSMIQAAHVGVGIQGREGTQAVRAADYAIGEFRFLTRLMFVHGRFSNQRIAQIIFYSLYKNLVFITVQFWFGFYNLWSGQVVYEDIFFVAFNVVFTSLPPLFYAIFEKDCDEDKLEHMPELFREIRAGRYWNWTHVLTMILSPIWHSSVIFFGVMWIQGDSIMDTSGRAIDFYVQTFLLAVPVLFTVMIKIALISRHWVWITFLGIFLSLIISPILQIFDEYSGLAGNKGTFAIQMSLPGFWFTIILIPVLCMLPDFATTLGKRWLYPADADIVMEDFVANGREERKQARGGGARIGGGNVKAIEPQVVHVVSAQLNQ